MDYHALNVDTVAEHLHSSLSKGLSTETLNLNKEKYGENKLSKKKSKNIFQRILSTLKEPMLIILLFSLIISLGVNIGQYLKTHKADFSECVGIFLAVASSVLITIIMEGSSEKAFNTLGKIMGEVYVKVIRDGNVVVIKQQSVVVGDVILLSSGDKIVADGRLIESVDLTVDESALTGESNPTKKSASKILSSSSPLADRENMVYSATFVSAGEGKMIVTAVGDNTEIGKIADGLKGEKDTFSPLNQKLSSLGKKVTVIGIITAVVVFAVSVTRLILTKSINFTNVQELFISSIILIVAAVPEGLPTIVAVSLALNMIKLSKENALIKKMVATETTGAVSVICSDKTGTLTLNKMSVENIITNTSFKGALGLKKDAIYKNFVLNTTADVIKNKNGYDYKGSGTECALIVAFMKEFKGKNYVAVRNDYQIIDRMPFSSATKIMSTTVLSDTANVVKYIKGAPEKVLTICGLSNDQIRENLKQMEIYQRKAKRILCFAHSVNGETPIYDGYVVLADKIRPDVKKAVKDCKKAGIEIKILTGDNYLTAYAVAEEIGVASSPYQVIQANEIEKMDDAILKRTLKKITVIARSTPSIKLRVVKALQEMGEVVCVTGDGINDAPAIRHADVGVAMGKTGSEITKETADVVLLDDSFSTIVKAVAFGRNVYKNLQRFILFQLSVNVSALLFITACAIIGAKTPFNTLQLLWINIIMDGPPALTLGLEKGDKNLMEENPVKRNSPIVTKKMFLRIAISGVYVSVIMILQYFYNILGVKDSEKSGVIFTLFILFQLSNAFNSLDLGGQSIIKKIGKNKIMLLTFLFTFMLQIIMVNGLPHVFGVNKLSPFTWIKTLLLATSILFFSELYKWIYRIFVNKTNKKIKKA